MAPLPDVIGFLSASSVRPPLSMRITAFIQSSATPNFCAAALTVGVQRSISWLTFIACSLANSDAAPAAWPTTDTAAAGLGETGTGLEKADGAEVNSAAAA